jgi:hypothetical protein
VAGHIGLELANVALTQRDLHRSLLGVREKSLIRKCSVTQGVRPRLQKTDISEFESYMASQPVLSPPLFAGGRSKSPRFRAIRGLWSSLCVSDRVTKLPFRRPVSAAIFRRLVFGPCLFYDVRADVQDPTIGWM